MRNFYDDLGLASNASQEDIKKAYRRQALLSHPDKLGGNEEQMKQINAAYAILSNVQARQQFDTSRTLFEEDQPGPSADREALFSAGMAYSQEYRDRHASLIQKYKVSPLKQGSIKDYLTRFVINQTKLEIMDFFKTWLKPLDSCLTPSIDLFRNS